MAWIVKICCPDGHRERDQVFGCFDSSDEAYRWARAAVPNHITWHSHEVLPPEAFNRQEWEARLLTSFPPSHIQGGRYDRITPRPRSFPNYLFAPTACQQDNANDQD
jgi:hypothetical protein